MKTRYQEAKEELLKNPVSCDGIDRKCLKCGEIYPLNTYYKHATGNMGRLAQCRKCINIYQRFRAQTWYKEKRKRICSNYKNKIRMNLISEYGGSCKCCNEKRHEFLTIDHVYGGGNRHRKQEKRDLYKVITEEGFPKDKYRLLCMNCNMSLGIRGYCPHQNEN